MLVDGYTYTIQLYAIRLRTHTTASTVVYGQTVVRSDSKPRRRDARRPTGDGARRSLIHMLMLSSPPLHATSHVARVPSPSPSDGDGRSMRSILFWSASV